MLATRYATEPSSTEDVVELARDLATELGRPSATAGGVSGGHLYR